MTGYINGVQQVTITIANGATTGTATITAAVGTAFIIFQGFTDTQAGTNPAISSPRVEITNSTTVTATRNTADTSTVTVTAVIVDATSSLVKTIQTGTIHVIAGGTGSGTATISSVTTANTAIAYLGFSSSSTTISPSTQWPKLTLTNATTVTASAPSSGGDFTVGFCVIEFQGAALNSSVQAISDTASPASATRTKTITGVTANNTMLVYAGQNNTGSSVTGGLQYGTLTNGTTITIGTQTAGFVSITYNCFVVEFIAGVLNQAAQRGTITLTAATSGTATITSSATANTVANFLGNSSTGTTYAGDYGNITQTNVTTITGNVNTAVTAKLSWEALEFVAAAVTPPNFINWVADFDCSVKPFSLRAQNSFVAQEIQPSPINQVNFYPDFDALVEPGAPRTQWNLTAMPIIPSPINQNKFYPIYDAQVRPWKLAAQYSISAIDKRTPSPITQNNWYAFYRQEVTASPLLAQYSFVAQEIQPNAINQTNWYPVYDPQVKPGALNSKFTYFSQLLSTPIRINNWYPSYPSEVKPAPLKSQFSNFSELLASPISINNYYPSYSAEVSIQPLNNTSAVVMPIPAIAASFTPISWYPAYAAEVNANPSNNPNSYSQLLSIPILPINWYPLVPDNVRSSAAAPFGFVVQPNQLIITPVPTPTIVGGHFLPEYHKGKRKLTLSNVQVIYDKAKELPRKQTKELRDAISEFVPESLAKQPKLPDIIKIDYDAIKTNEVAYLKLLNALDNIQNNVMALQVQAQQDDELLLMSILACSIH